MHKSLWRLERQTEQTWQTVTLTGCWRYRGWFSRSDEVINTLECAKVASTYTSRSGVHRPKTKQGICVLLTVEWWRSVLVRLFSHERKMPTRGFARNCCFLFQPHSHNLRAWKWSSSSSTAEPVEQMVDVVRYTSIPSYWKKTKVLTLNANGAELVLKILRLRGNHLLRWRRCRHLSRAHSRSAKFFFRTSNHLQKN